MLWLADRGMAAVLRDSAARLAAYQRQGTDVLLADLRGLGETADLPAFNDPKYYNQEYRVALLALHTGRPLPAQRWADVCMLLAFTRLLASPIRMPLTVCADGRAALPALYAAALDAHSTQVQVSGALSSLTHFLANPAAKDTYSEVLPGVLRRYDVPDLRRVTRK